MVKLKEDRRLPGLFRFPRQRSGRRAVGRSVEMAWSDTRQQHHKVLPDDPTKLQLTPRSAPYRSIVAMVRASRRDRKP